MFNNVPLHLKRISRPIHNNTSVIYRDPTQCEIIFSESKRAKHGNSLDFAPTEVPLWFGNTPVNKNIFVQVHSLTARSVPREFRDNLKHVNKEPTRDSIVRVQGDPSRVEGRGGPENEHYDIYTDRRKVIIIHYYYSIFIIQWRRLSNSILI